jgi:ferredoxin
MKQKLVLTFPPKVVTKPVTYHLIKDYNLVINILRAKIEEGETGVLVIEVQGPRKNFEEGVTFVRSLGVDVQLLAQDIILNRDLCVDCGACVGVCPPKALFLDENQRLVFEADKCILCENCVKSCPTRAITLKI